MLSDLLIRWADQLVSVCWQTALLALLVFAVTRIFPKLEAKTKTWLWWLVMLKAVVGVLVLTPISLPLLPSQDSPLAAINDRMDLLAPAVRGSTLAYPDLKSPKADAPAVRVKSEEAGQAFPWLLAVLAGFWALGVAVQCGLWIRDVARLRGWVRRARRLDAEPAGELIREIGISMDLQAPPRVAESSEITAPMVIGPWHPVVMLPEGMAGQLSPAEMRMVLAHELAHLRRKDLVLAIVPAIAQALLFFWPTHWLAQKEWTVEREVACDAEAIAATQADPDRYGRLLLKIVTSDHRGGLSPALGATAGYHTLRKRLTMMKETIVRPRRGLRAAGIALSALGMLLVLPWQVSAKGAAEKNEVRNPGFESGMQNWSQSSLPANADTGVTVEVDRTTAHGGQASLKFSKSRDRYFPVALLSQAIDVPSDAKKVKVDLWVKAEDVHKATLALMMNGGAENKVSWGAYVGIANEGDKAANHDWQKYEAVLAVPSGTSSVIVALEMYGPGTVWFDDVEVSYVPDSTPLKEAVAVKAEDDLSDVKDVSNEDLRAGNDPSKRYFLIGADKKEVPATGYKLLIVLPGGDGGPDFNPFLRRVKKNALPKDYIVAELVAPVWSPDQGDVIVWPTRKIRWKGMKFATEDFVEAVVKDVKSRVPVDDAHVYDLAWSSGGPAAYAISLSGGPIKGSFIAMSIYKPQDLGPASAAKGHAYYILHSPEDFIKISMAENAVKDMKSAGARAILKTYEGGHGWHGDIYGQIHEGVEWLESGT